MQGSLAVSRQARNTTLNTLFALCLGCGSRAPTPTLHYSTTSAPPSGAFWIAADTQLHNVTAGPSFWRSERVDNYAPGAIRPPSVDLWSGLVLRSILDSITARSSAAGQPLPLFYLGDAADISCTTEFRRFLGIMTEARRSDGPWFVTLGNHDGFYEGNITRRPDIPAQPARGASGSDTADPFDKPATNAVWSDACFAEHDSRLKSMDRLIAFERDYLIGGKDKQERDSLRRTHAHQGSLAKATSTLLYMDNLYARKLVAKDPLKRDSWIAAKVHDENGRYEDVLHYAADSKYQFLGKSLNYRVRASITPMPGPDDDRQWRAYIIQDVELADGTRVLLVDTSDLSRTPLSRYRNGLPSSSWQQLFSCNSDAPVLILGECGAFSHSQRDDAEQLMKQWPAGTRYFALGHHPLFALSPESSSNLLSLFKRSEFIGYVSAHTHNPPSVAQVPDKDRWEVNIGSTTDWPVHYARLNYWNDFTIKVDIFRPATKATCPYVDVEHSARGLTKYVDRAMANYRAVFGWIRGNLGADEIAALDRSARELGLSCPSGCLAAFENDLRATGEATIDARRERLAAVVRFDQDVLQLNQKVRDLEASCSLFQSERDSDVQSTRGTIRNGVALPLTEGKPLLPPRGE